MESTQISADISVIVVNWNTRQMLSQCLKSVRDNLQDLLIESFVVDNGSTDGSTEMVRNDFPEVNLIENIQNVGFAKANNQAIRLSVGRYILLLNSDAILTPMAIQKMVRLMDSDQSIGIAGAQLVYPDGRPQGCHGPLPSFWSEVLGLYGFDRFRTVKVGRLDYTETGEVGGACMLIRKKLLDLIGMLDENFFMFNEEFDLCNRCHKAGSKVVHVASATIIHVRGGSTNNTVRRIVQLYANKLRYFNKYFGQKAERRLKVMMIIAAKVKWLFYLILRLLSLGRIQKDKLWSDVINELSLSTE